MDTIKSCGTSITAVHGYGVVAYRTYALNLENDGGGPNAATLDALDSVETRLREDGRLLLFDRSKLLLWLFEPGVDAPVVDFASLSGLSFGAQSHGEFKAVDLTKVSGRASNFSVSATSSASPQTSVRNNQAANLRAFQANAQAATAAGSEPKQSDPHLVYEIFLSAVIASISYKLSRFHQMIPLNYRTFAAFSKTDSEFCGLAVANLEFTEAKRCDLVVLDVHLSTAGTIVISNSTSRRQLFQLDSIASSANAIDSIQGELVRVAPSGHVARFLGPETLIVLNDRSGPGSSKRARVDSQWKSKVLRWLRTKGICLAANEATINWSRIQLSRSAMPDKTNVPDGQDSLRLETLWPSSLCLVEIRDGLKEESMESATAFGSYETRANKSDLDWFTTQENPGFEDPLELAQRWWHGKPERDKVIESRRKALQTHDEPAPAAAEPVATYPSSPLYSRGSAYGDLQAASGVYPTPPDGVLPPGAGGLAPANPDHLVPHGVMGTGPSHGGPTEEAMHNTASATPGVPRENAHEAQSATLPQSTEAESNNDDLFGDMGEEEDILGGNDVTDADFNFFDDGDFMDLDQIQPTEANIISTDLEQVDTSHAAETGDVEIKLEPPPQDSKGTLAAEDNKTPAMLALKRPMEVEDSKPGTEEIAEEEEIQEPNEKPAPVRKVPTTPLSPSHINERLFPSPHPDESDPTSKRTIPQLKKKGSEFDPVDFSQKMSLADSKYSADGPFNFQTAMIKSDREKAAGLKSERSESLPHPRLSTSRSVSLPSRYLDKVGELTRLDTRGSVTMAHAADFGSAVDDSDSDSLTDFTESSNLSEDEMQTQEPTRGPAFVSGNKRKWVSSITDSPLGNSPSVFQGESTFSEASNDGPVDPPSVSLSSFEPTPFDWSLLGVPAPINRSKHQAGQDSTPRFDSLSISSAVSTPSSDGRPSSALEGPPQKPLSGVDILTIIQTLTQQIIFSTLDMFAEPNEPMQPEFARPARAGGSSDVQAQVNAATKSLFPKAIDCDLLKYTSIQDFVPETPSSAKAQPRPVPRRTATGVTDGHGNTFIHMSTPNVRIRRAEELWDVLPPALAFWEALGLSPSSGPKNIMAYCVYPHSEYLREPVAGFLDSLSNAYESCKLGSHLRGLSADKFDGGLAPVMLQDDPTLQGAYRAYQDTCVRLGKALGGVDFQLMAGSDESSKIDAVVIYMVNPFSDNQALWHLCLAFVAMFKAYASTVRTKQEMPDIVLQLVPIKYVASFDVPVVLDANDFIALAREVYDRCPPNLAASNFAFKIFQGPSVHLEETLPKSIPFRITTDPPSDLMHENSYIHVGYACSFDGSWVTVAWTDNPGKHQETLSYSLVGRTFVDVAKEVWQASLEIMQARRVTWRLCIARAGVMEREEVDAWTSLANSPCNLTVGTALVSVDTSPPFDLKQAPIPPTSLPTQQSSTQGASTPISTPQPGVSPDQHGMTPAATPSDATTQDPAADPDARLVDTTDDFYGVILGHRLNNSNSSVEYRPAIVSGYLVKRGTDVAHPSNTDIPRGPVAVGYNLLWIGAAGGSGNRGGTPGLQGDGVTLASPGGVGSAGGVSPFAGQAARNTGEIVLREFLGMYRGLGLLAKLRGMRGSKGGAVPWHVVVARRGVEALEVCL
ncbi:hypothetical protein K490DRAFT_60818 [Saccharata proteae CBS 121410]|uniref:Mediator of RNA polymerase II transcription subunit 13 n=1 Tax=Saccharata proteae CBS 121410 TaxID=1314787 RepID=A0A9P4M2Z9_9PEZI|nr:hypothetical protein K490DRAFT_60818 [Saccharata proteae CBS 121410]